MKMQFQVIFSILMAILIAGLIYLGNNAMKKSWKEDQEKQEVIRIIKVVDETFEDKQQRDEVTVKIESEVAEGRDRYITQIKEIEKREKEYVTKQPSVNDPVPTGMSDALRERRLARDRAVRAGKQPK